MLEWLFEKLQKTNKKFAIYIAKLLTRSIAHFANSPLHHLPVPFVHHF
jgi:hypothetical protein